MGQFHRATLTPTKIELIEAWVPSQPWGPAANEPVHAVGAYRIDDPEGRVGMEAHLIVAGETLFHVPLTYRDEPLAGAADDLVGEMHHSALGTRWIYDGLSDPLFVVMLAAVAMTGQGEALGMVFQDDRWHIAPSNVRIQGGGWTQQRVPVDGFTQTSADADSVSFQNDRFELLTFRRPPIGPAPAIGLTAAWEGGPGSVVLAEVSER